VGLIRAPWAQRLGLHDQLLHHNARTDDVARFLRHVHHRLRRPLLWVCDYLPAHCSAVRYLRHEVWLDVAWLPGYAPDLDPVENVWSQSKYGDLANFIADDISHLHLTLDELLDEYRHDPGRLYSLFQAVQLTL
jgi:transposase